MAATPITVYPGGFQTSNVLNGVFDPMGDNITYGADATAEMSFVNDGYTILYVANTTADADTDVTITQVRDNAGRKVSPFTITVYTETQVAFGPYRPIWFNQSGLVNVAFSVTANIRVSCVSLKF